MKMIVVTGYLSRKKSGKRHTEQTLGLKSDEQILMLKHILHVPIREYNFCMQLR